jgi:hypothetical protein
MNPTVFSPQGEEEAESLSSAERESGKDMLGGGDLSISVAVKKDRHSGDST